MIYVCIPARDEAPTVGLVLWKTRRVFEEMEREYQLLVADDGSGDRTPETLKPYTNVLPLTVVRHDTPRGYGRSVESLLRQALERTDRPRRDCALVLHADFAHGPDHIPDLVKRIDSGADLVIAEGRLKGEGSRGRRLIRRWASWIAGSPARRAGVRDAVSGFFAVRLSCLKLALQAGNDRLVSTEGWAARAELVARLAAQARRVETVQVEERHDLRQRATRVDAWSEARGLWRARHLLRDAYASAAPPAAS